MDVQRLMTGYPMSESERIQAIEAAHGLNYSQALPTDNPKWTDIKGNTVRNAQDIFTGLEPTNLAANIFDTIKNTVVHPDDLLKPIGDLFTGDTGAAGRALLAHENLVTALVPGVYDLATVLAADPHLTGAAGGKALAKQPITALLDIVPFGRVGSEALGRTAAGARTAERIDVPIAQLRKMGIWRVGGKLIKTAPAPSLFTKLNHPIGPLFPMTKDPVTGMQTPAESAAQYTKENPYRPTLGETWDWYKNKHNFSSVQADIHEEILAAGREESKTVPDRIEPALRALGAIPKDELPAFTQFTQNEFRPLEDVMHDNSIPENWRNAYAEIKAFNDQALSLDMQAGKTETIHQPIEYTDENREKQVKFVDETYYIDTAPWRAVTKARDDAQRAQDKADKTAVPFQRTLARIDENDYNVVGLFEQLGTNRIVINDAIKRTIPHTEDEVAADRLRSTLPGSERWDRAVSEQTPFLHNLLGLLPSEKLTGRMVNAINELFADGGLLDQMKKAYEDQDWQRLFDATGSAMKVWNRQKSVFGKVPRSGRAQLYQMRQLTETLRKYASERKRLSKSLDDQAPKFARDTKAAQKAHLKWIDAAVHNPTDQWRNVIVDQIPARLAQEEKTAESMDIHSEYMREAGFEETNAFKIQSNPRTMQELMGIVAENTLGNAMLPDVNVGEWKRVERNLQENYASVRARGETPLYVHMVSDKEVQFGDATTNVYVHGIKGLDPRKPSFLKSATWGFTPTIHNFALGLLQRAKDMAEHDATQQVIEQSLVPQLIDGVALRRQIAFYYQTELGDLAAELASGEKIGGEALFRFNQILPRMNLKQFDSGLFGGFNHPTLHGDYYIDKNAEVAFNRTINEFQYPANSIVERGTRLFRSSILGLSPRYTAHILFGGTFMMLARGNLGMVRYLGDSVHYAIHGSFSEKTLMRFPAEMRGLMEMLDSGSTTEEGLDVVATQLFHYRTGNWMGRHAIIPEWLARHGLEDNTKNRIKAAASANMTFTRAIRRGQEAMVYLDGASRALRGNKHFYEEKYVYREPVQPDSMVDAQGRPVYHPVTKRQIADKVRSEVPMTPQQAHVEGMKRVAEVFGNLRHMTPLERGVFVKIFPFYGWTKHVLTYVMTYPFDHPWRAMILGNLALMHSESQASGLPLRLELLTMLGKPDQFGNVTAIDTKSMDPFRDTANYATLTGLFESLNPAITGFGALVDPQFSFAGQNMYPQITFNSLYGVKTAGAGGNIWNAAEQYIPQLQAADAAFNLSGQYAYLKQSNPAAFQKKIFESLGLPFTPQQINVRQLAAQGQIDRYQQAHAAALKAAQTGDTSGLAGYTAVPDPLNTMYEVTPAYIDAMSKQSEQKYGLPWYATAQAPPNPPL
jgi:hypothetical protein